MNENKHQAKRNQERDYNQYNFSVKDIKKAEEMLIRLKQEEKNEKELIGCSIFFIGVILLFVILCIIFKS